MLKTVHIVFLFLFCVSLFAQEPIRYTTKQGLPSNHIYDIQEDAEGFMWFATNRGLVKFDGETFKTFTIQDGLPNNDTWLLELDYQGKLWYFSKSSYQGYVVNDSIFKFHTEDKNVISPRFNFKTKDSLWFYSSAGMQTVKNNKIKDVGYGNPTLRKFTEKYIDISKEFDFDYKDHPPRANPKTRELAVIKQNEVLFFDWNLNYISKTSQELPRTFNNKKLEDIGLLYNQIYYIAFDIGVLFVNFNTKTSKDIPFNKYVDVETVNYFKCKGLKDEIQISIPGHLLIFNYDLELITKHSFPNISNNRISYKDSKGNIWLADFTEGITLIPNSHLQSNYYLKGGKIQKLGVIDSELFAGVNDDGFYKFSKEEKFKPFINEIADSNGEIYQIKENPNYLISARKSFKLIGSDVSQIRIDFIEGYNSYNHTSFKDIISYKNNTYHITSDYLIIDLKAIIKKSGLIKASQFKDKLYFAGSDGLHQLKNDTLIRPINSELINVSVNSLEAIDDHLLVATDGRGVYCYDGEKVFHLKDTDGLSVQRIIKRDDFLWLATQIGVIKVEIETSDISKSRIIDSYYESDGLLQDNVNDIFLQDSLLYAATDVGISELNLNSKAYKKNPELYFKTKKDTLRFKNDKRDNISITFAAKDFANQEHLTYQFKLLPNQENWQTTKTKVLNFSNLPPDTYSLEVKATDQHQNSTIAKQYFIVEPKWHETKLAFIGFTTLVLFGFALFLKVIKKQIEKKEALKAQQDKRIAGLELQALRSQMNPHFVHNSLNAIQYYIQRNEVELSENYLVKFSKLIRLFFEYSRRQTITIAEEVDLLTHYLEIEKLRFEEKLSFLISLDEEIDSDEQVIPSMLLQPIVENAVNHGLFHKQVNGKVSIYFKSINENSFQIIVKDDGIGVNAAKKIYKSSSKNYQSNSSTVLQERLELLNQSNDWKIDYEIEDLFDTNKDETGTQVTLTFKQIIN